MSAEAVSDRELFLGVDIGGTFTDVVVAEEPSGRVVNVKRLTTPRPEDAVLGAIAEALGLVGVTPGEVVRVVHATTLATNLILERKGARVVYATTKGFGRLFQLTRVPPTLSTDRRMREPGGQPPLLPTDMFVEFDERVLHDGSVLVPLDETSAAVSIEAVAAKSPSAVAVCFLHSYANPSHEELVASLLRARLPGVYVALSSELWPEAGEVERAATTLVSAYVGPTMAGYVGTLERALREMGVSCRLQVMQSSGSVMPATVAAQKAVFSIESGPAAGVIMSAEIGRRVGRPNLLSFDMGGTTAKVGLIRDAKPEVTRSFRVGESISAQDDAGLMIRIPVIDLAEVGAGGGSIVSVDAGGFLHVGPASAGARPGPACYGLGGERPTVTDANVVLGYLNPGYFLGGKMRIDSERSREAIAKWVAGELDVDVTTAAHGIYELANLHMGTAVRVLTVQRGIDPRDFAITALGGAGPLHIARVAEQFGIPEIVVPPSPGLASAFGLLTTDIAYDLVASGNIPAEPGLSGEVARIFGELEIAGREQLGADGFAASSMVLRRATLMHFQHQAGQLDVSFPAGPITESTIGQTQDRFRDLYDEIYGVRPDDLCVFVNFSVRASGTPPKPRPRTFTTGDGQPERARKGTRDAFFPETGGMAAVGIYDRTMLRPGDSLAGPVILEEPDSTVVCPPGYALAIDEHLDVVVTRTGFADT